MGERECTEVNSLSCRAWTPIPQPQYFLHLPPPPGKLEITRKERTLLTSPVQWKYTRSVTAGTGWLIRDSFCTVGHQGVVLALLLSSCVISRNNLHLPSRVSISSSVQVVSNTGAHLTELEELAHRLTAYQGFVAEDATLQEPSKKHFVLPLLAAPVQKQPFVVCHADLSSDFSADEDIVDRD